MQPVIKAARARRFTVQIRAQIGGTPRKVAKVIFSEQDGSLYVDFPYFENSNGLVSIATLRPGANDISLVEDGRVTSHLVKYAHHRDGEAHFSQTGKVLTAVRRKSIPLTSYVGHIFTIQIQGLTGFRAATGLNYDPSNSKDQPITLDAISPEPCATKILGFWFTKRELRSRTSDPTIGPGVNLRDVGRGVLLSAPCGTPGAGSFLVIAALPIPAMTSDPGPQLTFIGGFDPDDKLNDLTLPTQFLALAYPATDTDLLRERLSSIDLPKKA